MAACNRQIFNYYGAGKKKKKTDTELPLLCLHMTARLLSRYTQTLLSLQNRTFAVNLIILLLLSPGDWKLYVNFTQTIISSFDVQLVKWIANEHSNKRAGLSLFFTLFQVQLEKFSAGLPLLSPDSNLMLLQRELCQFPVCAASGSKGRPSSRHLWPFVCQLLQLH